MAGSTVTVEIDNGDKENSSVEVQLDANGNGQTEWTVPTSGWFFANFNAPDATEKTSPIVAGLEQD